MAICLSITFLPIQLNASTTETPSPIVVLKPVVSAEANALVSRLDEIKYMDESTLSRSERKGLRKEVRSIQKNLHDNYGGVYISVGALIIIILLLILIF